eukprot:2035745-Rhodomonas_salina.1
MIPAPSACARTRDQIAAMGRERRLTSSESCGESGFEHGDASELTGDPDPAQIRWDVACVVRKRVEAMTFEAASGASCAGAGGAGRGVGDAPRAAGRGPRSPRRVLHIATCTSASNKKHLQFPMCRSEIGRVVVFLRREDG